MAYQQYPYAGQNQPYREPGPYYNAQPSYKAPAAHYQAHSAPPPPPQQQHPPHDPFRAWYADRLRELTFNSRPIIQELSVTAMQQRDQSQWGNMTAVVEEIEAAIYRSPPHEKLPKLYLIDSISKNVGPPYTTHLLPHAIPRLYVRTYREVDGVTKSKMEEMISLWRRSGPDGGELYGASVRESVEREIFGSTGMTPNAGGMPGPAVNQVSGATVYPPARDLPTRDRVLAAIHATIQAKHAESAQRPWDRQVQTQLGALMGLSEMVNTRNVGTGELQQIMDQLRGMGYIQPPQQSPVPTQSHFSPPAPAMQAPQSQSNTTPTYPPANPHPNAGLPPIPNNNAISAGSPFPPFAPNMRNEAYPSALAPTPIPAVSTPVPPITTPVPSQHRNTPPQIVSTPVPAPALPTGGALSADVLSMLANLAKSGSLPVSSTSTQTQAQAPKERSKLDEYESLVLGLDLRLSNLDINRMTALPIDHLPVRCSQCSTRFASAGQELNDHMDWHVRRNRQDRIGSGRGAHRRWLPRADEWVNDIPTAGSSTAPDTLAAAQAGAAAGAVGTAGLLLPGGKPMKSEDELRKRWIRVPSTPGAASMVCPICKEGFKREWAEEEEEWVWRNAVDINGKIMHATCRQTQLIANRVSRQTKGRSGSTGTKSMSKSQSPGHTPEPLAVKQEHGVHPLAHAMSTESTPGPTSSAAEDRAVAATGEDQAVVSPIEDVKPDLSIMPDEVKGDQVTLGEIGGDQAGAVKRKASEEGEEGEEERKRAKVSAEAAVAVMIGEEAVNGSPAIDAADNAVVDSGMVIPGLS